MTDDPKRSPPRPGQWRRELLIAGMWGGLAMVVALALAAFLLELLQ